MVNLSLAKKLQHGTTLFHKSAKNADGTAQRFIVSGKPKLWKRDPQRIRVPLKRGLYQHGYLDSYNITEFSLVEPKYKKRKRKR